MDGEEWAKYFNVLISQVRKDLVEAVEKAPKNDPRVKAIKDDLYVLITQEEKDEVLNRHAVWMGMVPMPLGTETKIPKYRRKK